jgi:hypothetical protein
VPAAKQAQEPHSPINSPYILIKYIAPLKLMAHTYYITQNFLKILADLKTVGYAYYITNVTNVSDIHNQLHISKPSINNFFETYTFPIQMMDVGTIHIVNDGQWQTLIDNVNNIINKNQLEQDIYEKLNNIVSGLKHDTFGTKELDYIKQNKDKFLPGFFDQIETIFN